MAAIIPRFSNHLCTVINRSVDTSPFLRSQWQWRPDHLWLSLAVKNRFTTSSPNSSTDNGYSPSFEEIGEGLGLSSLATVHKHISNLEEKGLLRRDYNRSRSIDVLKPRGRMKQALAAAAAAAESSMSLPLMGRIAAGRPLEAVENPETISLTDFTRSKDVYVLQVTGESMQDEHIVNGDYVLVEKTKTARDGEIVVALVNGSDATLKRIYAEGDKIRLQPSNAAMQPIVVPAGRPVQVQGRYRGAAEVLSAPAGLLAPGSEARKGADRSRAVATAALASYRFLSSAFSITSRET